MSISEKRYQRERAEVINVISVAAREIDKLTIHRIAENKYRKKYFWLPRWLTFGEKAYNNIVRGIVLEREKMRKRKTPEMKEVKKK